MGKRTIGMLLLAMTATGCSSGGSPAPTVVTVTVTEQAPAGAQASSAPAAAPPAASQPPAAAKTPKVGDAVILAGPNGENLTATLVKVVDPATGTNNHPETGTRFIGVEIQLVNHGSKAWAGNGAPTTFAKVIDSQGQAFGPILASTNAGVMYTSQVTIAPGGTALGAITFQVPTGSTAAAVQINLDRGTGPHAEWQIH